MTNPPIPSDPRIEELLGKIRAELSGRLAKAKRLLNLERLRAYWQIGRFITEAFLDDGFHAQYGSSIYRILEERLELKERVLQHMAQFYRLYPEFPKATKLTWTHYRYLINISDAKERKKAELQMIRQGISSHGVKAFIPLKNRQTSAKKLVGGKLLCKRGLPYLYAIRYGTDINGKDLAPRLDLGFKAGINSVNAPYISFVKSRLVFSIKENNAYRLETYKGSSEVLYTYKAVLDRIVDGDTVIAIIDIGFGIVTSQRLRLRGIDTPEMSSPRGQRAKEYLTGLLKGFEFVVVKTYKDPGMYGRFLTDLFIQPGCNDLNTVAAQGLFVNQHLLDEGLAKVYK